MIVMTISMIAMLSSQRQDRFVLGKSCLSREAYVDATHMLAEKACVEGHNMCGQPYTHNLMQQGAAHLTEGTAVGLIEGRLLEGGQLACAGGVFRPAIGACSAWPGAWRPWLPP